MLPFLFKFNLSRSTMGILVGRRLKEGGEQLKRAPYEDFGRDVSVFCHVNGAEGGTFMRNMHGRDGGSESSWRIPVRIWMQVDWYELNEKDSSSMYFVYKK